MGYLSRAVEKRWHPAKWPGPGKSVEKWLITGKNGEMSYTGKDIDEEIAMSNTAIWSGVSQLSTHIASLPLHLYMRLSRGKKRAINHKQYNLLHLKPNPFMSSMAFREAQVGQVLRYGICYAEKEFDENGNVIALWPLLSRNVQVDILLNDLVYVVTIPGVQKPKVLDKSRVVRVNGFSSNGIIGYNPIQLGKESIALALAIEEYGSRFYGNGARPAAVLEHPQSLTQPAQDRLRENWNKIHQGLENSHRLAILEEGMKLHEFSQNAEDSQLIETRVFQIGEVARILNMPLHMLKELSRSTFNNLESLGLEYVIYTLRPWLVKFEQEYTIQLLSDKDQKKYFYEHLVDGLLRGDIKTRHESYAVGRQWGWYSANDILEMENKNGIGEQGDIYLIPMNMVPADKADDFYDNNSSSSSNNNSNNDNKDDDNEDMMDDDQSNDKKSRYLNSRQIDKIYIVRKRIHDSYNRLFVDSVRTILNRESLAAQRAIKKHSKDTYREWIDSFFDNHSSYIRKIISPVVISFSEQIAHQAYNEIFVNEEDRDLDLNNITESIIRSYSSNHISESKDYFTKLQSENNEEEILEWIKNRSENISQDEILKVSNIICHFIFYNNHYECFTRVIKEKPCDHCKDLNSKEIENEDIGKNCCCIITI